ncbi:MAG: S-layer family protein [Cyanobacteriota bacterium]|nr:S-layer family protein [Cyanobacteriota bacterium]
MPNAISPLSPIWVLSFLATTSVASAQIVPDGSLPIPSTVTQNGNTLEINGGITAGSNLFHSFQEFSVPTGSTAFFDNAPTFDTIFARVTGGQISNIDGLIHSSGTADLFLINPTGIIFGTNARLDIGGSFMGSTADGIQFADGSVFSATNPQAPSLLAVNVPIGLQFGSNPGDIRVQGAGHQIRQPQLSPHVRGAIAGLQVQSGNTLALVGGNILLEGGTLTAESGRIELGSVANGEIGLSPVAAGWSLSDNGIAEFRDITLTSKSAIDASGAPSGSIQLQGRNFELRDASLVLIQNQGSQPGGDIAVNLSGDLIAIGFAPERPLPSSLVNETVGSGDGGDLKISSQRLIFLDAGQMGTRTFAPGRSGDVIVDVSDSVVLAGFSLDLNGEPFISNILTLSNGNSGKLGDIRVLTRQLTVRDGGLVASFSFGSGDGGNVEVNTAESVELVGFNPNFSGSSISTTSLNAGQAGDVVINTARLTLRDGGRVDANTIASGDAGNVIVNASELIEIRGTVPNPLLITPSLIGSAANTPDPALQQFLGLAPVPSGSPGNVTINTSQLRISDGALVTVRNDGSGDAGFLSVRANSIVLDDGSITASTASGEGGNIDLQVGDFLLLRSGSIISAEAGSRAGTGNGGNLNINSPLIVAVSRENSDIIANAFAGNGGNINIETDGIFGLAIARGSLNNTLSEINASSRTGISGTIAISNPEVDTSSGLVELPQEVRDPSDQVVVGCAAARGNSFTITGRGGLPEDPIATIRGQTLVEDLRNWSAEEEGGEVASLRSRSLNFSQPPVEARGWTMNGAGNVELVAQLPPGGVSTLGSQAHQCSRSRFFSQVSSEER